MKTPDACELSPVADGSVQVQKVVGSPEVVTMATDSSKADATKLEWTRLKGGDKQSYWSRVQDW